ncbi:MAG: LAGLIDADG family homing endonuclease [Nanoarchaeota archaeon]
MTYIKRMVMHGFKSFAKRTEVVFDQGINVIVGPNGSGKSLSYGEIVTLADGNEIEIGKLVEQEISKSSQIKTLDDGIYVDGNGEFEIISLNKENMKIESKKISKFIKREGEEIYRIRTRNGKELKATGCHPVMSFVEGKVESQVIKNLREGDVIASPREIKIEGKNICSEEFARLIGYIIGDGYIAKDRIEFVNNDKEIIEDFKEIVSELGFSYKERIDKGVNRIYIRDKEFVEKIRGMFIKGYSESITSGIKKIPNLFLQGNKTIISNLLSGLYDTDGSVRKDIEVIEYCTKNKDLARQIQNLLLRFGILSKIKKRMCCATNTENKTQREYNYIYIYGHENLRRFEKNINLKCKHKLEVLTKHILEVKEENSNVDLLPKETNLYVKRLAGLLGIQLKPIRKEYPALMAYSEDRCLPTRKGIVNALKLFEQKYSLLQESYHELSNSPACLIETMDNMNISGQEASKQIGLSRGVIRNRWATRMYNPRPQNLQKFYSFIKESLELRIEKARELIILLKNLANSDIFWDEIVSIEKLEKEKYVYDLTIEDNHNFIANNLFAHNSNVSDALCFVLGRLSIKSMRAAKAKNLLFMGSKYVKPVKDASVELVFDNSDKKFGIEADEVALMRIVKHNGASVYKINGETKTRIEVIETLAQAGIDPYGFNLVLQGQIQSIISMHPEDRRKIIEEVAGIAIYEARKEKALKELEKTDDKLKEINSALREKGAFLRNLEKERTQAMKYTELQLMLKRCKASILNKKILESKKDSDGAQQGVDEKAKQKDKKKGEVETIRKEIEELGERANAISKQIQQASGLEQESLHNQIANLKVEIEGLRVRKESFENRKNQSEKRIAEMQKSIPSLEQEITELNQESPLVAKKASDLKKKKDELAELEEERKKILAVRSELNANRERIKDKEKQATRANAESEHLLRQLEDYAKQLKYKGEEECNKEISNVKSRVKEIRIELERISSTIMVNEKKISVSESEISKAEKVKGDVSKIDICPLCRSKITPDHINHVSEEQERTIISGNKIIYDSKNEIETLSEKRSKLYSELQTSENNLNSAEVELVRHKTMKDKQDQLKRAVDEEKIAKNELQKLEERKKNLEEKVNNTSSVEERYHSKMLEIEEISSRTLESVDQTLLFKTRELDNIRNIIKQTTRDIEDHSRDIEDMGLNLGGKQKMLAIKDEQEKELQKRFKKLFEEREHIQREVQDKTMYMSDASNNMRAVEDQMNMLKVAKARIDATKESLEMEFTEYSGVEIIQGSQNFLEERLQKTQEGLMEIGSINMRALEVYDELKKEFDSVQEKVLILDKEKIDIMSIIAEIDNKKKKTFMKTFRAMSDLFSQNFSRLYSKGIAYLEMENREDIFSGGVNIVVRLAKGKYFDVTSLSGGEKTLVAISLLFAIQEYKPYSFYIFDEIDAALDKRNSERLASLLNQYMKNGQYIVITHNDAIIMNANLLYGVSMHDGVSKVLSLDLNESLKAAKEIQAQEAQKEAEDTQKDTAEKLDEFEKIDQVVVPSDETRDVKS